MTSAVRCELCPTVDGVKPLAVVHVSVYALWPRDDGSVARTNAVVEYDLCQACYREAEEAGDLVVGAKIEVL